MTRAGAPRESTRTSRTPWRYGQRPPTLRHATPLVVDGEVSDHERLGLSVVR